MALYTVSAQVALSTFHKPKPTCGISAPVLSLRVGEAIFANVWNRDAKDRGFLGGTRRDTEVIEGRERGRCDFGQIKCTAGLDPLIVSEFAVCQVGVEFYRDMIRRDFM